MVISLRVTNTSEEVDDIGFAFPRFGKPKPSEPAGAITDEQSVAIAAAMNDPAVKKDYVAKLSVPLANTEQFLSAFVRGMLKWFVMYNLRIKNLFMGFGLIFQKHDDYQATVAHAQTMMDEVVGNAKKRSEEGQGSWFTSAIIEEEAMSPASVKTLVAFFRKTPKVDKGAVLALTGAEEKQPDADGDVQGAMNTVDPFASPQVASSQIKKYEEVHDAALGKELEEIKMQQNEIASILETQKEQKEAEEQQQLVEIEKERRDNSFMRQRLGMISKVFRQIDVAGRGFSWLYSSVTGVVINSKMVEGLFDWISKQPLDKMLDFTAMREKINSLVFHRIGLHQGSFIYNMTNSFAAKLWFILEPLIKGYGALLAKLTAMQQTFFAKYSVGVVKYVGGFQNIGHLFYNYYVKLVYIVNAYILSLCIGIYFWYIVFLLKVIRFILNLILARFGISI